MPHLSEDSIEKYLLGLIREGPRFDSIEEHLLGCPACTARAEEIAKYIDAMRAAAAQMPRRR